MRNLAILTLALTGFASNSFGQDIKVQSFELRSNIRNTQSIDVPEGKVLEIVDFFATKARTAQDADGIDAVLETAPADGSIQMLQARPWNAVSGGLLERTVKFVGPMSLFVRAAVGSNVRYYLYYRLRDNAEGPSTQASQAVVIPEDANGDVEIILESSKDLINWTAAAPGTYNSATTDQRFFRVRAVKQ